ncbi:alpha/beta hydrolase [Streptomyces piniterrae]|uniref:Alpha/beta hydrolase n=1 Tax=Streptomyces piniterrae TaxID=2571125 RepID=A0A4U0NRP3_9ACTN|nr:alpha/beta hydrolase [Streptomyces piniterrae]TJZ57259.1 alpha/beta hydrolase [Streptomyces piniterrae]
MTVADVVLVHGLWSDGSSWSEVIPFLHDAGHRVVAVQLPLTSLEDDVVATRRVLERMSGPVVLAGWSYGGTVITNAAVAASNVSALVYVAAFAPDKGESSFQILQNFGATVGEAVQPYEDGLCGLDPDRYREVWAADLPAVRAEVLAAVQKPSALTCLETSSGEPAWRSIRSWYQVAEQDRALPPVAQRFMAERMGAVTTSVPASHSAPHSRAREVADLITRAAVSTA